MGIGRFTELMVKMQDYERDCKQEPSDALGVLMEKGGLEEGDEEISEIQFLRFGLLKRNLVTEDDIREILEAFQSYGPKEGKASKKIVEDSILEACSPTADSPA